MVRAIQELQDAGVEADVWKIEGLESGEDCEKVVRPARRGGRDKVGCIVLGRGEDDKKVREWLTHGRGGAGLHRLRGRPDDLLGATGRLARAEDHSRSRGRRDRARYRSVVGVFEKARWQLTDARPKGETPCSSE